MTKIKGTERSDKGKRKAVIVSIAAAKTKAACILRAQRYVS